MLVKLNERRNAAVSAGRLLLSAANSYRASSGQSNNVRS